MEIDVEELQKQRKEEIFKEGKYVLAEIVIPEEGEPIISCCIRKANVKKIVKLIVGMKILTKQLIKKYPLAGILSLNMDACGIVYNEEKTKTGEINKWKDQL